ncbi:MAG: hypothetical protein Q7V88_06790 [Actinomycetota bacterium]|nr:hypothetical protein [Actinomycetota bacterium]
MVGGRPTVVAGAVVGATVVGATVVGATVVGAAAVAPVVALDRCTEEAHDANVATANGVRMSVKWRVQLRVK